ncbi:MAG: hypothetical protein HDS84_06850 [Bacteroidales bacterium]|nr:hypothetical protein [Bacteroidales bacterium]
MPRLKSAPSNAPNNVPLLTGHGAPCPYIRRCLPRRGTPRPYNVGYKFDESTPTSLHFHINSKIPRK